MDFSELSQIVRASIIDRLDHHDLNEVTGIHTTAEHLAHWIWGALIAAELPEELLYRIGLWETEGSLVEITREERRDFVP